MQPTIHFRKKLDILISSIACFFRKCIVGCIFNSVGLIFTREIPCIQDVIEIRVLILTSGRTRQFVKLFSNILQNSQKISKIFCPQMFTKRVVLSLYFFVTSRI
jgi:hypothetical protein